MSSTYWKVSHSPNISLGGKFEEFSYISLNLTISAKNFISDWCYTTFGNSILFDGRGKYFLNWFIEEISEDDFLYSTLVSSSVCISKFNLKFDPSKGKLFKC